MDTPRPVFTPPAPVPRTGPVGTLQLIRTVYRNPLELWGEPSYNEPWVSIEWSFAHTIIANDPGLIRHVLVDNARNYRMAAVRQRILRPILRDGLLTAEGETWKRSRKAMAPVFTPRHIHGFAEAMKKTTESFADRYADARGPVDVSRDMTMLTYDILAETLFSGEIAGDPDSFSHEVDRLFETMGRVDPLDLLGAPEWLPRFTQLRGRRALAFFRQIVASTIEMRKARMDRDGDAVPSDFLTLLLRTEGPDGLSRAEIEDNIITFIGAGHETTARALGWTLYLLSKAPWERDDIEQEIDDFMDRRDLPPPHEWLDALPLTRAAFEEAMRLYPPAPSINREPVEDDRYQDLLLPKGAAVLVMPWTVHRHRLYWEQPDAFLPSRFHPENRSRIDRFQYLPFGAGPRVCIGASFALQEAVIALAILLHRYRFDMADETQPWPVQKLTTQPDGGLPMVVIPRR
ncbi:cytochrome P450 [Phyllobacterium sp. 0TCS1.6C]|uniref:cytochrome P450 n=1 Tax=unclassified Phyllobacterium TaxID=2638441 RepID=UPI0022650071|nr:MULTISPECIES: cytochrome P450 [unclassified Phyllobacterium]MCX8282402.1 cytochrome P450 [Phyllobacterium sp. 0TCS1.6C]MCX8295245.1 cytochrome P450 [Phyllobacterium sp. 0TCS1.6A]